MRIVRTLVWGCTLLGIAGGLASSASALSITGLTITTVGANTANSLVNTGNPRSQVASSTTISLTPAGPQPDTIGSLISFQTRYAWLVAADREGPGAATVAQNATAEYQITFTVNNPAGMNYQISIDTLRAGALTVVDDDATVGATGSSTLGAVTGSVDSIVDSALGLTAVAPFSSGTTNTSVFSQTGGVLTISDNALTRTVTLNFTWNGSATSTKDESAIRMGINGSLTGPTTADDYPGIGGRTASADGHFVNVTTQIVSVPEPHSGALLGLGLLGVGIRIRRITRSRAARAA
jgi:PEP-CTERM motif-containing protein